MFTYFNDFPSHKLNIVVTPSSLTDITINNNHTVTNTFTMRSHSLFQALGLSSVANNPDVFSNIVPHSPAPDRVTFVRPLAEHEAAHGRRRMLESILFGVSVTGVAGSAASALDMDAFAASTLENEQKNCDPKKDPKCIPKISADQALCTYGQSGAARGEACKRVKAAGGSLPSAASQGRSLGGAYAM